MSTNICLFQTFSPTVYFAAIVYASADMYLLKTSVVYLYAVTNSQTYLCYSTNDPELMWLPLVHTQLTVSNSPNLRITHAYPVHNDSFFIPNTFSICSKPFFLDYFECMGLDWVNACRSDPFISLLPEGLSYLC